MYPKTGALQSMCLQPVAALNKLNRYGTYSQDNELIFWRILITNVLFVGKLNAKPWHRDLNMNLKVLSYHATDPPV